MMRAPAFRIQCLAILCGLLAACGQTPSQTPGENGGPTPAPPATTSPSSGDPAVDQASALIRQMIEAYRAPVAFFDRSTTVMTIGSQTRPPTETTIRMGPGPDFDYATSFFRIVFADRALYVTYHDIPDRYLYVDDIDDVVATMVDKLGEQAGRMALMNLRFGRTVDDIVQSFSLGLTGEARISGYREIEDIDGRALHQITLATVGGSATINVDPKTKFLHTIETEEKLAEGPLPNLAVRRVTAFATEVFTTAAPIEFDRTGRFKTDSIGILQGAADGSALRQLKLTPGTPAPDFVLHTLLGERVVLSERKGRIVVLVFWASWDLTCRQAVRQLSAIVPWAESNNIEVDVLGVCGMRRRASEQNYYDSTLTFWEREELPYDTLIDQKDKLFEQYGVLAVPMTIVLDHEGRFVNAVAGFEEGSLEAVAQIVGGAAEAK